VQRIKIQSSGVDNLVDFPQDIFFVGISTDLGVVEYWSNGNSKAGIFDLVRKMGL
jgi:hypothetical protein